MNSLLPISHGLPLSKRQKGLCANPIVYAGLLCAALVCAPARSAPSAPPSSLSLTAIYSFPSNQSPQAGLLRGTNGVFYATSPGAGTNNLGAIVSVTPEGVPGNSFYFNGANGSAPFAPLIEGGAGLFGTTSAGGFSNNGTIFRIAPSLESNTFVTLVRFGNANGAQPLAPLVIARNGVLYGTTFAGGANGLGTVFAMTASGVLSNLYSFAGTDGENPDMGLIQGKDGNLYGATRYGGTNGAGTLFAMSLSGSLTNVFSFDGANGAGPRGLIQGSDGNFYGATLSGGDNDLGTLFEMTPSNTFTLFSFNVPNSSNPNGPLLQASDGSLYGVSLQGGISGLGTIFRFLTNGPSRLFGGSPLVETASFNGADGAYPYGALIQDSNGNLFGTASYGGQNGTGTIFELTGFAPVILRGPVNIAFVPGSTARFTATVAGSAPFTFQWLLNGAPLANGTNLSGSIVSNATSTNLVVSFETSADVGTFSIIVSNQFGSITDAAALTVPAPALVVQTPPPIAAAAAVIPFVGSVVDRNIPAINVQVMVGTTPIPAVTTNQFANWSASLPLQPGSNLVQVWAVDQLGNPSRTNSYEVFYYTTNPIALATTGFGSIATPHGFNPGELIVGKTYTITAVPAAGNVFSNWTGSATSTSPKLTFLMASNMTLTANFVTNVFTSAAGVYNGLFLDTNDIAPNSAGMLSALTVNAKGAYSGRLLIGGSSFAISGAFTVAGATTNIISRSATAGGPLALEMYLDLTNGAPVVLGAVSSLATNSPQWTADLTAERETSSKTSAAFTLLMFIPEFPQQSFNGYAVITNHAGIVTVSGAVADGTAFAEAVPLSEYDDIPVYASLYKGAGLLLGWINLNGGDLEGDLQWIKPSSATGPLSYGVTNLCAVEGSPWTNPPPRIAAISLNGGHLTVSGGFLATPLVYSVSVNTANALAASPGGPTNSLTGSINAKTGLLTITFGNGVGKSTASARGVILQDQSSGAGFFITRTNAGAITLTP